MKVSLIQMNSVSDKAANIARRRGADRAGGRRGEAGLGAPARMLRLGGRLEGREARQRREPARRSGLRDGARAGDQASHFRPCRLDHGEDRRRGRIHNTSVVFNREGEEIARYRKIHMFDVMTPEAEYRESATVAAGDKVVTYDCEGVTVGCSICYDLRFPDLFQALAEKGAEMIALPAAFTHADRQGPLGGAVARPRDRDGDLLLRQRADRRRSRPATSSGTLMAIRWSPTPGAT